MRYTFSLYDTDGLITERSGTAVLPPDNVTPIFEGRINTGTRIPTQTFVTIETDAIWLPAEIGREQFTVTSRRLVSADSKPRLDAEMRNTSVAEARDVEIVATIFDRAGNALTASRTIVPIFEGHANENVVFTWPEPIAKTVRSCEVPTDVVLAIDVSGSMNDDGGTPPEPITSVLSAAEAFVGRLGPNDQVAIVTYATDAALPQVLTSDKNLSANVVANLSIAPASETGSTNTGDAIILTNDEINSARHNQNARKVLVLLTDGRANAPGETPEEYAQNAATALKETDVEIYTIGLGDTVNEAFLESIASDSSNYFRAVSVNTINQIYSSITAEICEDGAAVIEIIPKTATSFAPLQ
jgi:Mg-chelatase subunit ChlD